MKIRIKKAIKTLPQKPGVYIFKDEHEAVLYIGKATNLKKRVASHFARSADRLKEKMIKQITAVDFIRTKNENQALILEEQIIKKFQPKFNVARKDDKSYFWVFVSDEKYPRIWIAHKLKAVNYKLSVILGPFVNGRELKSFLRQIRKIAPFRTCRVLSPKACLQYDLGNCPGWCVKINHRTDPCKNIGRPQKPTPQIKLILELLKIYQGRSGRLEAYDISNIQGQMATGSLVVFQRNRPHKKDYRLFKIKTVFDADDPKMQGEIISRRIKHQEWSRPDLILLDGGKGQLSIAGKVLKKTSIPYLGLAKKEERLYSPYARNSIRLAALPRPVADTLMHLRDEAHRFALRYHRQLRAKNY
ncbi:MAG: hypothetical protein COU85_00410 [Candidatus Portnoybacteria bacterium CG10_big_fil_rev_8_21_14_0_10_44_7]|uniref:Excinuclease ABC subunit C n=1 Tax=Candidatus Portnoybacteria bacterium CG10_big_fil_rev_8_21_14_0_10_44_7 TaxID=1974816 RepID=A0A2M8KJD9_9BACT|nr:MAG: hypothetical protein COU85_00410 [Candidatus Portnoybacteria bacterium CG10_big_fil_rev_8_21_14_0_10_44_7]